MTKCSIISTSNKSHKYHKYNLIPQTYVKPYSVKALDQYWEYKMLKGMTPALKEVGSNAIRENKQMLQSKVANANFMFQGFYQPFNYAGLWRKLVWQCCDFLGLGILLKEYSLVIFILVEEKLLITQHTFISPS